MNGTSFAVDKTDFNFEGLSSGPLCAGGIQDAGNVSVWVVGTPFMQSHYSVFRFDPPSIGLAPIVRVAAPSTNSTGGTGTATGTAATGTQTGKSASGRSRFTGSEYAVVHAAPPGLFIIHKRDRTSPTEAETTAVYYILNDNVYQGPTLYTVVNERILTSLHSLSTSLSLIRTRKPTWTPERLYEWDIKEPAPSAISAADEPGSNKRAREEESTTAGEEGADGVEKDADGDTTLATADDEDSSQQEQPAHPQLDVQQRKRSRSPGAESATSDSKRAHSQPDDSADSDQDSLGTSRLNIMDSLSSHAEDATSPASAPPLDNDDELLSSLSSPSPAPSSPDSADDDDSAPDSPRPQPYHNVPDGPGQIAFVNEERNSTQVAGESSFLVSRAWFRRWSSAASGQADAKSDDPGLTLEDVGPIDNSLIADQDGQLRREPPVVAGVDVELLPNVAWRCLVDWYGVKGPTFERAVVGPIGQERVEFYPPTFVFSRLLPSSSSTPHPIPTDPTAAPRISASTGSTVVALRELAVAAFSLPSNRQARLWRLPSPAPSTVITGFEPDLPFVFDDALKSDDAQLIAPDDSQATLSEALLDEPLVYLALEQVDALGNWVVDAEALAAAKTLASTPPPTAPPAVEPKKGLFAGGTFSMFESKGNALVPRYAGKNGKEKAATPIAVPNNGQNSILAGITGVLTRGKSGPKGGQRGLTGLGNLGNTCFMNSALQCMSNTKELQEYFLSGVYKSEINRDNPLGMKGQVADAFGQLIERLWSPSSSGSYAPREFKQALSKFAPAFTGYGQQDSQELLAFLLDGTHEDLNRIRKKPSTASPDWVMGGTERDMVEMAKVCWEQYRARNDSVIVDLFQGQYRSTVVCPDCDKVSITFDPFMYVTTNLPNMKQWTGKVYLVPADPTRPRYMMEVEMPKSATIKMLKATIGALQNVNPHHLIVAEEWKGKFYKNWYDDEQVLEVTPNDNLIFYESTAPCPQPKPRRYGKAKPAPPVDPLAPIVLAVQHTAVPRKKLGGHIPYGKDKDSPEVFGTPFVVTLTPEEASTQKGIYMALARHYARVSKKGEELIETSGDFEFHENDDDEPAPAAPAVAPKLDAVHTRLPETPPPDDIRVDDSTSTSTSTATSTTASAAASSRSSLALPAVVERPLFDIWVSRKTLTDRLPFDAAEDFGNRGNTNNVVPLAERARQVRSKQAALARRAATPATPQPATPTPAAEAEDVDMASPTPNQTPAPDPELDGEPVSLPLDPTPAEPTPAVDPTPAAPVEPTPAAPVEPSAPAGPVPLVRTGDFLVTEWDPAAVSFYFGADGTTGEHALWSTITNFVQPSILAARSHTGPKPPISLVSCLNEFTKEERLGEDDQWYCPDCKKHQQATKKVEIWKVPDVLVFALKRFSAGRYSRDKIDDFVDFPVEGFDVTEFVEGEAVERRIAKEEGRDEERESLIYDLYAVDNHYGGMGGGHYTAYAKNPENDKWYEFDDSRVSPIEKEKVEGRIKTKAAYLLFYRRRTTRPIGAKSRQLVDSAIQSRAASATNSDSSRPSSPGPSSSLATSSCTALDSTTSHDSDADDASMSSLLPDYSSSGWNRNYDEPIDDLYSMGTSTPAYSTYYPSSSTDLTNFGGGTSRTSPARSVASDTEANAGTPPSESVDLAWDNTLVPYDDEGAAHEVTLDEPAPMEVEGEEVDLFADTVAPALVLPTLAPAPALVPEPAEEGHEAKAEEVKLD
ncbi:hypothetical protein RQP46_011291 [Phenoliferia psychrophenolica]